MAEAGEIAKARPDARLQRIAQIENDGLTRHVIVGEQLGAIGHPVFGMVNLLSDDAGGRGGDELTVAGRLWIGIDVQR